MENEIKVNMRGGEKETKISHFLKAELPNHIRLMGLITLIPGASIGEHVHEKESEVFYIISGNGKYLDEGKWIDIQTGDVLLCKSGGMHSLANNGTVDLVLSATIICD